MGEDFRTQPLQADTYTYYVFDNLRSNQDQAGGDIFRYDTVEQAIAVFQHIQAIHPEWTIALGGSINGRHEIDYIQRRNGDNCLVSDYQKIDAFRDSPEVKKAIDTAVAALKVDWQVDHELTGNSILIPYESEQPFIDHYLDGKNLRPSNQQDVLSSIQEIFVQGEGWVSLQELRQLASFEYQERPEPPKVTHFNVSYESRHSDSVYNGYVDVGPSEFRFMKDCYFDHQRKVEHPELKTMQGWHAFTEKTHEYSMYSYFQKGDAVGDDVVNYFVNMLFPITNHEHLVQIGSSYDSVEDEDGKLRPTFGTFAKEDGVWHYCGNCFRGEKTEPASTEKSITDLAKEAKERAEQKNLNRPEMQRSKSHNLEL